MKLNFTKSKLYGFAVGLAVLGLLVMPVVGTQGLKGGSGPVAPIEDETDWTLAKNKAEDVETDWTLASNDGIHEEEIDWTLA